MDKYLNQNKALWNEITPIHERSAFYDVDGFKAGKSMMIMPVEIKEMGDVKGKSLLHLQCHFGMDTLTWGRLGAKVTGVDFSDVAIKHARELSKETGIKAEFMCSDIYRLPEIHKKNYDIVYTSGGVLCWLPDLKKWAEIIYHFLKPGGFFYIFEGHPFSHVFDESQDATELKVKYPYFHTPEPSKWGPEGDYADPDAVVSQGSYEWNHSLGDIINSIIMSGLKIEFLHEFPIIFYKFLPFLEQEGDKGWRTKGNKIPLTFSIKATKPFK
jgi:SAM-dependent methyltransferase